MKRYFLKHRKTKSSEKWRNFTGCVLCWTCFI